MSRLSTSRMPPSRPSSARSIWPVSRPRADVWATSFTSPDKTSLHPSTRPPTATCPARQTASTIRNAALSRRSVWPIRPTSNQWIARRSVAARSQCTSQPRRSSRPAASSIPTLARPSRACNMWTSPIRPEPSRSVAASMCPVTSATVFSWMTSRGRFASRPSPADSASARSACSPMTSPTPTPSPRSAASTSSATSRSGRSATTVLGPMPSRFFRWIRCS